MILHSAFILRQIRRAGAQALIFVVCVQLSIVSLVAINGFAHNVRQSLLQDSRSLHAADIIVRSNYPFSGPLGQKIDALAEKGRIRHSRVLQFYSLARTPDQKASLLSGLKAVEPGYPFYGQVLLRSGDLLANVLTPGRIVVEQSLLERLGLAVGDSLRLGQGLLTIADVVLREPDRPVTVFSLGPRIFVPLADLDQLGLVQTGSRVRYKLLVQVNSPEALDPILAEIRAAASPDERVDSFQTAPSRIKRFFDNLIFFLALMGVMTLLLAGIGIQSTLSAMLKRKAQTIAIMKTVGATSGFIVLHFMAVVLILGSAGTLLGLISGWGLQYLIPLLFSGILPDELPPVFTAAMLAETVILGLMVVGLFSFLPLNRLRDVKPVAILRHAPGPRRRGVAHLLIALLIGLFFSATILWQLQDLNTGLKFVAGILALIAVSALLTRLVLMGIRRLPLHRPTVRQAVRGLFRPGNLTRAVITTLTAALAALFTMYGVERNLYDTFVSTYPPDTPNLFCINIQPDQREAFQKTIAPEAQFHPVVRARITAINDDPIDLEAEQRRRGDNLARPFNLTYRDHLLPDESLLKGNTLFDAQVKGIQVSVL